MSRAPNYEFQEWWNKQRERNHEPDYDRQHLLEKSDDTGFVTVEIGSLTLDPTAQKERSRSRKLSWVCLLRFHQLASFLAWLANAFVHLLRTANRRFSKSPTDSASSLLYRAIKFHTKPPEPPKDNIHVEARRDQATDSDSLAERVRREKNSERMKLLQDLVPGCNKVTGKVLILDEIIKYVQSLQRQVEVTEAINDSNSKQIKTDDGNGKSKAEEETKGSNSSGGVDNDEQAKTNKPHPKPPEPPKDYIHVRARGQATISHSLAERVRREKISERMKLLQDLVPGCNKVTGKALMLDEIINYVQSLQRQVEFLSMELASVNNALYVNTDSIFLSKDIFKSNTCLPKPVFPLDSSYAPGACFSHRTQQQNPVAALHDDNISNRTMYPVDSALSRNLNMQLTSLDGFSDSSSQFPTFSGDDLQAIVQMGFGQNPNQEP